MRKVYELDDHFFTGESSVQPVILWGRDGRPLRERFSKTASEASDYIQHVQPQPGKTIVLVLALGAYETYGLNRNGDGFNEHPFKTGYKPSCGHAECEKGTASGWVGRGELLTEHFKSFEQHGKIYRHHQNKDPAKSCGDVIKAFWNPQMHRVELLLALDNSKATDLVPRIADGEYPAVSMGCRIKHDVCTICGHRAPTRAQYCDHLKFSMRQVVSGGLQAGALNPSPKFFDISFVVRPADQTGYMMKKVAEHGIEVRSSAKLGEELDIQEQKQAALRKFSAIEKSVLGVTMDSDAHRDPALEMFRDQVALPAARRMPVIRKVTIRVMSGFRPQNVLSTLGAAGVQLTTAELLQMLMERLAPGLNIPERVLDAATFVQPLIHSYMAENPNLFDQAVATGAFDLAPQNIEPEIAKCAEEYLEKRSTISDYLMRRLIPASIRAEEPPTTDVFTLTDPATGTQYRTNRGAAIAADERIARQELAKMVGGGALLTAAHKVVSSGLPPALRPVSAGVALLAGSQLLRPNYGPQYMTDQGVRIPVTTEMAKAGSDAMAVALPLLGTTGAVTALAHDYESRLRRGDPVGDPTAPLYKRLYDRASQMAYEHPGYSLLASLAAYGLGRASLNKFAEYVGPATLPVTDAVDGPRVDFDRVAEKIGALIWP